MSQGSRGKISKFQPIQRIMETSGGFQSGLTNSNSSSSKSHRRRVKIRKRTTSAKKTVRKSSPTATNDKIKTHASATPSIKIALPTSYHISNMFDLLLAELQRVSNNSYLMERTLQNICACLMGLELIWPPPQKTQAKSVEEKREEKHMETKTKTKTSSPTSTFLPFQLAVRLKTKFIKLLHAIHNNDVLHQNYQDPESSSLWTMRHTRLVRKIVNTFQTILNNPDSKDITVVQGRCHAMQESQKAEIIGAFNALLREQRFIIAGKRLTSLPETVITTSTGKAPKKHCSSSAATDDNDDKFYYMRCTSINGVALRNTKNVNDRYTAQQGPKYNDLILTSKQYETIDSKESRTRWVEVQIKNPKSNTVPCLNKKANIGTYFTKYIPMSIALTRQKKFKSEGKQIAPVEETYFKSLLVPMPFGYEPTAELQQQKKQIIAAQLKSSEKTAVWYSDATIVSIKQYEKISFIEPTTDFVVNLDQAYEKIVVHGKNSSPNMKALTTFFEKLPEHSYFGGISLCHSSGFGVAGGIDYGDSGNWNLRGTRFSPFWGIWSNSKTKVQHRTNEWKNNALIVKQDDAVISFGGKRAQRVSFNAFSASKKTGLTCIFVHTKPLQNDDGLFPSTNFSALSFPKTIPNMVENVDFTVVQVKDIYKPLEEMSNPEGTVSTATAPSNFSVRSSHLVMLPRPPRGGRKGSVAAERLKNHIDKDVYFIVIKSSASYGIDGIEGHWMQPTFIPITFGAEEDRQLKNGYTYKPSGKQGAGYYLNPFFTGTKQRGGRVEQWGQTASSPQSSKGDVTAALSSMFRTESDEKQPQVEATFATSAASKATTTNGFSLQQFTFSANVASPELSGGSNGGGGGGGGGSGMFDQKIDKSNNMQFDFGQATPLDPNTRGERKGCSGSEGDTKSSPSTSKSITSASSPTSSVTSASSLPPSPAVLPVKQRRPINTLPRNDQLKWSKALHQLNQLCKTKQTTLHATATPLKKNATIECILQMASSSIFLELFVLRMYRQHCIVGDPLSLVTDISFNFYNDLLFDRSTNTEGNGGKNKQHDLLDQQRLNGDRLDSGSSSDANYKSLLRGSCWYHALVAFVSLVRHQKLIETANNDVKPTINASSIYHLCTKWKYAEYDLMYMLYEKYNIKNDPLNVLNMKRLLPERHLMVQEGRETRNGDLRSSSHYYKKHLFCISMDSSLLEEMVKVWNTEIIAEDVLVSMEEHRKEMQKQKQRQEQRVKIQKENPVAVLVPVSSSDLKQDEKEAIQPIRRQTKGGSSASFYGTSKVDYFNTGTNIHGASDPYQAILSESNLVKLMGFMSLETAKADFFQMANKSWPSFEADLFTIGTYETEEEAALAWDKYIIQMFGTATTQMEGAFNFTNARDLPTPQVFEIQKTKLKQPKRIRNTKNIECFRGVGFCGAGGCDTIVSETNLVVLMGFGSDLAALKIHFSKSKKEWPSFVADLITVGTYKTEEEAALAWDQYIIQLFEGTGLLCDHHMLNFLNARDLPAPQTVEKTKSTTNHNKSKTPGTTTTFAGFNFGTPSTPTTNNGTMSTPSNVSKGSFGGFSVANTSAHSASTSTTPSVGGIQNMFTPGESGTGTASGQKSTQDANAFSGGGAFNASTPTLASTLPFSFKSFGPTASTVTTTPLVPATPSSPFVFASPEEGVTPNLALEVEKNNKGELQKIIAEQMLALEVMKEQLNAGVYPKSEDIDGMMKKLGSHDAVNNDTDTVFHEGSTLGFTATSDSFNW